MSSEYLNDTAQAQRACATNLKFILANKDQLRKRRNGLKHLKAMESISKVLNNNYSSKQMSYVDSVYEMVMQQIGLPSYKGQKSKYGMKFTV